MAGSCVSVAWKVHQPHQPAEGKPSIRYHKRPILLRPRTKTRRHQQEHQCIGIIRGDRCLKDYGFRLSQAVDSAEVTLS
ncbi:hypothetical protein EMCRGX_G011564 [Ephydatia muelleri]